MTKKTLPFCDMMIHTDENISLGKFIEQVVHYLKQLRNANLTKSLKERVWPWLRHFIKMEALILKRMKN